MTSLDAAQARRRTREALGAAVHTRPVLSRDGLNERLFTLAFGALVYPQIWEDPVVDMDALAIGPEDHVVAIASGGCNVMSYLTARPAAITAVDLSAAHLALLELKLCAARKLDSKSFARFFHDAADARNVEAYDDWIAPHLGAAARRYWDGRGWLGRRRIEAFARGFYRTGQLGRFIRAAHLLARLHGVDPRDLLAAPDAAAQRAFFETRLAPLFEAPLVRALVGRRASLIGLGIPPRQYDALAGGASMAHVLKERLGRLVSAAPLAENYFARQALGLAYGPRGARPPYLDPARFDQVREGARRVRLVHGALTQTLAAMPAASADCFVMLDAQDWMDDAALGALWRELTRVGRPGARALFRTAADAPLIEGRIEAGVAARWRGDAARDRALTAADRAAIYGRVHLRVLET
ncbi:MAG: BtaA family protein [Methylobacteriaceae bacterium]|nr:BtaA family protein [Methylobacteriaceae bacterium]